MGCLVSSPSAEKQALMSPQPQAEQPDERASATYKVVLLGDKDTGAGTSVLHDRTDLLMDACCCRATARYVTIVNAGKSSLNAPWTHGGYFHDIDQPTVVASYSFKKIRVKSGGTVRLQLWDTGGAQEHSSLTTRFLRSAQAGVIIFDVSNRESFLHCNQWIKGFKEQCPDALMILVGNEARSGMHRKVSQHEANVFAHLHRIPYYETSTSTGINVMTMLQNLADTLALRDTGVTH